MFSAGYPCQRAAAIPGIAARWSSNRILLGVTALEFLGLGETLAVAEFGPRQRGEGGPGRLLLYDVSGTAPRQKGTLEASSDMVVGLASSPRIGELLVTGGGRWDQTVKLWRHAGETWQETKALPKLSDWWPRALAFSPDEKLLATVSGNEAGPVQLWNIEAGGKGLQPARVLPGPAWAVSALAFSPNGRFLVAGLGSQHRHPNDGQLLAWDLTASPPKLVHQATGLDEKRVDEKGRKEPGDITGLAFLPGGNTLVSGDQHGLIRAWNVTKTGALEPAAKIEAHQRGVRSLAVDLNGQVLSTGNDGYLVFWKPGETKLRRVHLGDGGAVMAAAPSGRHFAVGLSDGRVYIVRLPERGAGK